MTRLIVGSTVSVLALSKFIQSWATRSGNSPEGSEKVGSGDMYKASGLGIFRVGIHHGAHEDLIFAAANSLQRLKQLGNACGALTLVVDCNEGLNVALAEAAGEWSKGSGRPCIVVVATSSDSDPELADFASAEVDEFIDDRRLDWKRFIIRADSLDSCTCAVKECETCGPLLALTTPVEHVPITADGFEMTILHVYEKVKVTPNRRLVQAVPFGLITSGSVRSGDTVSYFAKRLRVEDQVEALQEYGRNRDQLVQGDTATLLLKNSDAKSLRGIEILES